jgi:ribonuclease PH
MIGEQCIIIDCDVIQADGGTRTASINGGVIALFDALKKMKLEKKIDKWPVKDCLGAISVGIVDGKPLVDLDYIEDSGASVDMNVVMTGSGKFVELQVTGEESTFTEKELQSLVKLAKKGITEVIEACAPVLEK